MTSPTPTTLPLDLQRDVVLALLDGFVCLSACPKDNGISIRAKARELATARLVSRDWHAFATPLMFKSVTLPRASHLRAYTEALALNPALGEVTIYLHFYGHAFPARFLPDVLYRLPNLRHFLSQADATTILDRDVDLDRPRLKLWTLEIDPGLKDPRGKLRPGRVERWTDLSELRSLAVVNLEGIDHLLQGHYPHLQELHLMLHDDSDAFSSTSLESDPDADPFAPILSMLRLVGRTLVLLRLDLFLDDPFPLCPQDVFALCPNLVTLSFSGLDVSPLLQVGHPTLAALLVGDPWSYWRLEDERAEHALTEEDKVVGELLARELRPCSFPSLRTTVLWNCDFAEESSRSSFDVRHLVDILSRKGWQVGDRFLRGYALEAASAALHGQQDTAG